MLRSTFYGFSTGLSGLKVSQNALDVIGQNVANANTEGYTRQRVLQNSIAVSTVSERYGSKNNPLPGNGAMINSLGQIRDVTLDSRFRTENASLGRYDAELSAMSDIETIFDEAINSGMRDAIQDLETAFHDLSLNTGNDSFDVLVRSSATSMTKLMNQYAKQVEDYYNAELYDFQNGSVADANKILKELAVLNDSIKNAEVAGDNPLELYDRRNTLIDSLSAYGDIEYNYETKTLAPNIQTDILHINLKLADGTKKELINGEKFAQFGTEIVNPAAPGEEAELKNNTVKLYVTNLVEDTTLEFEDIKKDMEERGKTVTDLTPVYGLTQTVDSDGNPIDVQAFNGKSVTNGIFLGTLNMLNGSGNYEYGGSTVRGYQYYMEALDTLASTMAAKFNEQNQIAGKTAEETNLFTMSDGISTDHITAKNISISDAWIQGDTRITNTTDPVGTGTDTTGDNSNILKFIALFKGNHEFTGASSGIGGSDIKIFEGGFEEFLSSIGEQVALDMSTTQKTYESFLTVCESIDNDRMSVSGVSIDEEAVDIYKFQRAYEASSRVITALDELLDKLINSTGVVGR